MQVIGIDPGVNTGFAVKHFGPSGTPSFFMGEFVAVKSLLIHKAQAEAKARIEADPQTLFLIEDARLRTWYGDAERAIYLKLKAGKRLTEQELSIYKGQLQGSGSVRRDCTIWEDYLTEIGAKFILQAPKAKKTKVSADYFKRAANWTVRTNEHGRDAGMMIIGLSRVWVAGALK